MFHPQTHEDQHQIQRSLHSLIEGIKDKDYATKREHLITTLLEDAPKSFTRLFGKDTIGKEFASEERIRSSTKYAAGPSNQVRLKHTQKNFFKALQEEHRLISRENMQLLGLTIRKISYIPKNKKGGRTEAAEGIATVQPEVLNFQNTENIPQSQFSIERKPPINNRARALFTRPQSIRARGKQSSCVSQRRRRSVKPYNPQYQNPIYEARIASYRQLLFKLQWSYGFYSEMQNLEELRSDKRYKVWVGGGNNSMLIRELMRRRFWWQIVQDKSNYQVNFVWTQLKLQDYFNKQKMAPLWHLAQGIKRLQQTKQAFLKQHSRELNKRSKSRKEIEKEKQGLKEEQFLLKIMPEFQVNQYKALIRPIRNKPLFEKQQSLNLKQFSSENERMHNHLTHNFHLGNKKALFYNLKEYYQLSAGNLFNTIPLSFHIKTGTKDPQYKRFVAYYKKRQAFIKKQEKQQENGGSLKQRPMRNIWIVKPGQLTNRGNGITVIDEVYELDSIIKSQKKHDNGSEKTFIVQLYIDRPFLYKKRKFDIRHYMMISQINGVMKAYWFKQGYIRTASYQFDIHSFEREIHLTNDAIQKYTPHYGKHEPANKVSYLEFQKYLDANYPKEKYSFQQQILPKMKAIGRDAVRSTFIKISPERNQHNFEIFGLDFMIDGQFLPWLIEVNTNPCLQLVCPLLTRIIPQMVDQALRLTLDVIYPPPTEYPNTAKHMVPEASLETLKWELIFDQRVSGKELRQLYRTCKGNNMLSQIGDISDDQVYQQATNNQTITLQEVL